MLTYFYFFYFFFSLGLNTIFNHVDWVRRSATPRLVAQRWQGVSLPLHPGFKPQRVRLSPMRCLTCSLGLQDVQ